MPKEPKYEVVEILPKGAIRLSKYAKDQGYAHNYIYVKYDRALRGEGKTPVTFKIVNWQGMNFVVPQK